MILLNIKKIFPIIFSLVSIFTAQLTLANSPRFWHSPIPLYSRQGESMLSKSTARNYPLLSSHYIEQKRNYCGIASMVIVLNSLKDDGRLAAPICRRHQLTQDNFFTPDVQRIIHPCQVAQEGITLKKAAKVLALYPIHSEALYANKMSLKDFRKIVQQSMNSKDQFIIANFSLRMNHDYGHFSPLAAYHPSSDSVLIMDVIDHRASRWVKLKDLFEAMRAVKSNGLSRGALLIASKSSIHHA